MFNLSVKFLDVIQISLYSDGSRVLHNLLMIFIFELFWCFFNFLFYEDSFFFFLASHKPYNILILYTRFFLRAVLLMSHPRSFSLTDFLALLLSIFRLISRSLHPSLSRLYWINLSFSICFIISSPGILTWFTPLTLH